MDNPFQTQLSAAAEANANKFYHAQGDIQQVMPWSDCKESFQNGASFALTSDVVKAMAEALDALLADTQHADHNCGDEQCPVDFARKKLAAYREAAGHKEGG